MKQLLDLRGVYPATLTPFQEDYSLDEAELRRCINDLMKVKGIAGFVPNGHAGEVTSLSSLEYCRVLEIIRAEVGDQLPLISGVVSETPQGAASIARNAKNSGADAILLFPPSLFGNGGTMNEELPLKYVAAVAEAVDIPIVIFQLSVKSGMGYTTDTLTQFIEKIPSVIGIKEGSDDMRRYEENVRALRSCSRRIAILSTNNSWLFPSLVLDGDGIISGAGSVIAELLVELWEAIEAGDLFRAKVVNCRIFPITQAFYTNPQLDMHNRMKAALKIMGRQQRAVVRPPLVSVKPEEQEKIRQALIKGGLLL